MTAFLNDVKFRSATSGLADFGIGAVVSGFQLPTTAGAVNGTTYSYTARVGTQFESGQTTSADYSTILERTTVLDSSAGFGVKVNFSSAPTVILTVLAADLASSGRTILTADTTYYVATTGSDTTGDGSVGNPWATLQYAADWIYGNIDFGGHNITINIGAGTFAGVDLQFAVGGGYITFVGAGSGSTIITYGTFGLGCFYDGFPGIALQAMTLSCSTNIYGIYSDVPNSIYINDDIIFDGAAANAGGAVGLFAPGATFLPFGSISVTGTWKSCLEGSQLSAISNFATWTMVGTPSFANAFANIYGGGLYTEFAGSYTGAATGRRFNLQDGTITGVSGNLSYFPGDTAGTWTAGFYDDLVLGREGVLRKVLTADTTYYVATTGSDTTGDGSAGNPWLTIQYAYDYVCATLDFGGFAVTIQVADGTYSAGVTLSQPWTGGGSVTFTGNTTTPANVHIDGDPFFTNIVTLPGIVSIQGFKTSNSAYGLYNDGVGTFYAGLLEFGTTANAHITADIGGALIYFLLGDIEITGNAQYHVLCQGGAFVVSGGVVLTGTPDFSIAFLNAENGSVIGVGLYTGAATGVRFRAVQNSVIYGNSPPLDYLPGDQDGILNTGGIYGTYGQRIILLADTTYYVATTGSDTTGDGSVGNPWATPQFAYDYLCANLDFGGYTVTVQVADGTYSAGVYLFQPWTGGGQVIFSGNTTTPSNVHINGEPFFTNFVTLPGIVTVKGFKTSNSYYGLYNDGPGVFYGGELEFGSTMFSQITADVSGANIVCYTDRTISGGSGAHILCQAGSNMIFSGSVTVTGTPNFSTAFVDCENGGVVAANDTGYFGAATGVRFRVVQNAVIWTPVPPLPLDWYPGDQPGLLKTGGVYDQISSNPPTQPITASAASLTVDYLLGTYAIISLQANVTTFAVSNWQAGENRLTLEIDNTGAFGITFPTGWLAVGGTAPTITSGAGKKDKIMLTTSDAGSTVFIDVVGQNYLTI